MHDMNDAGELLRKAEAQHRAGDLPAAIALYQRVIAASPDNAQAYNGLGGALSNAGKQEEAAQAFQRAISLKPDFADPHLHLATLLRLGGNLDGAVPLLERALRLSNEGYYALMELGAVNMLRNNFAEAELCFRRALERAPGDPHALHNLGRLAFETGREDLAIRYYGKALEADPGLAACWTNLGIARRAGGDYEGAAAAFERALALEPSQAEAVTGLAGLHELEGRYREGLELVEKVLAQRDAPLVQLAAARLERRLGQGASAISRLEALSGRPDLAPELVMQTEFALGDLYDDAGRYDEAWARYERANGMKRPGYRPESFTRRVDQIIEAFPAGAAASGPRARLHTDLPVFIVGMPRSGTSLVEQILASHRAVHGAGELTLLARLVDGIPQRFAGVPAFPEAIAALSARRLTRLGRAYLRDLEALAPESTRVTDKMWQNFEYLGLIERMLPGARVIHCRREPLDSGLSCYFQHFAGQVGVPFSYDLTHIGAYYRDYDRLMRHWREACSLPVLELEYESLVVHPEELTRRLVDFLGLEWDPACLDFHRSKRAVNTASLAQVKEPIYTRSVQRHARYAAHLEPLRRALAGETGRAGAQ